MEVEGATIEGGSLSEHTHTSEHWGHTAHTEKRMRTVVCRAMEFLCTRSVSFLRTSSVCSERRVAPCVCGGGGTLEVRD